MLRRLRKLRELEATASDFDKVARGSLKLPQAPSTF